MAIEVGFTGAVKLDIPEEICPVVFNEIDITARIWELAGAFDGSTVRVRRKTAGTEHGPVDALELKVFHPKLLLKPMVRKILSVEENLNVIDVIENVEFYLKEEYRGQGIGKTSLLVQALAANALGFKKIWAIAAGYDGSETIGFKVWPKLGYDTVVPDDILKKMPLQELMNAGIDLTQPVLLSMLIDKGLFPLWEKFGEGCQVEFDVSSLDSWSMTRLSSQFEEDDEK